MTEKKSSSGEGQHVNRRRFLQVSGAAITATGLETLRVSAASDDTVQIPVTRNAERVLKWKDVPSSWYDHTQQVREATDELESRYRGVPGVISVGSGRGSELFGGKRGLEANVTVDPSTFSESVPEQYNGVNVSVSEGEQPVALNCDNLQEFDNVPGGVTLEGSGKGTSCCRVSDSNDNTRMLTANHLWGTCDNSGGDYAYQNGDYLGYVDSYDTDADYALVDESSDESLELSIKEEDTYREDISGWKTESGVEDLISNGTEVNSMGVTTGRTTGTVEAKGQYVNGPGCIDLESEGVQLDMDTGQGDSGGPSYNYEYFNGTKYAVIINLVNLGDNKYGTEYCYDGVADGNARDLFRTQYGTPFYHLYNAHGISTD